MITPCSVPEWEALGPWRWREAILADRRMARWMVALEHPAGALSLSHREALRCSTMSMWLWALARELGAEAGPLGSPTMGWLVRASKYRNPGQIRTMLAVQRPALDTAIAASSVVDMRPLLEDAIGFDVVALGPDAAMIGRASLDEVMALTGWPREGAAAVLAAR